MKSLIFLSALILCAACAPQASPTVELSATPAATQTASVRTKPASTSFVSPTPIFEILIDNVAIGGQGQLYASGFGTYGDDVRHFAEWGGAKWIGLGHGMQTAGNSLVADSAGHLYTDALTDSQQGTATAIMKWDGARWQDITGNFVSVVDALRDGRVSSNVPVVGLAVDGEDHLYAAGAFYYLRPGQIDELPMGYVAKWNQNTWTVLGQGFDKINILALAVNASGQVHVSGEQPLTAEGNNSYIAQWDGEMWKEIKASQLKTSQHIALDKSGDLYVSGQGSEPDVVIVYWDGANWITIADQLQGEAPAVFDMAVDANGHLYIGGSFEAVSGVPARNIAYWVGSSWHALGSGLNERAQALAFDPSGELYVVGFFTEAGGLPVQKAARWDGETWHALEP